MEENQKETLLAEERPLVSCLKGLIAPTVLFTIYFLMGASQNGLLFVSIFAGGYLAFAYLIIGPSFQVTIGSSFLTFFWLMLICSPIDPMLMFIALLVGVLGLGGLWFHAMIEEQRGTQLVYSLSLALFVSVYYLGKAYLV
ncbi:MAG: hypothetical protein ACM3PZ_03830 [Bacillota bacterium]